MKDSFTNDGEKLIKKRRFNKHWHKVLLVLSCVVVFCTTYALILPAITMEQPAELATESLEKVENVIAMIDALPDNETVTQELTALSESEDEDGYDAYLTELAIAAGDAYAEYEALTDEEKAAVTNADKLLSLEWLWSADTYATAAATKPTKDNSDKLTIVQGADTSKLIEINLYDYGSNINVPYSNNKNLPGFQQDNGTTSNYSYLSLYGFNFGNNITADLGAGITSVTNQGGTINTTRKDESLGVGMANLPIEGAMYPTLVNGYPALADGTSLDYLWSDNTYATKKNTQSVNGLFLYHDDTGAYTFNSRENHAQFNASNNTFTLYDQIITSNFMMYPFGNFLPFNDIVHQCAQASTINRTYLTTIAASAGAKYNAGGGSAYNTLNDRLTKFLSNMDKAYPSGWTAKDCVNAYFSKAGIATTFTDADLANVYSIDYDEATDFYFGMEMKMNFIQPKDGLTGLDGKQPMVFYFTGDDDVWIYIDNVLFLDLSGIHRHVGGEIDFVNGVVKYYYLDVSTGDVSTEPYKTVTFAEILGTTAGLNSKGTFENYSSHSFNFYYMERGAGSGVCRMNFNFPLLRQNSISVSKELELDEGDVTLLGNPDFKFQILKEGGKELFIGAGVEYTVLDENGNEIGTGTTDANGIFTIKANQTARFDGIDEDAGKYFVRELLDAEYFEQYGKVIVNGTTETKSYDVTVGTDSFKGLDSPVKDVSDGSTIFRFSNQVVKDNLGALSIEKTMTLYGGTPVSGSFDFDVTLDGEKLPVGTKYTVGDETRTVETEGVITLAPNEKAVISGVLAGSEFTVVETTASAADYVVTYKVNGVVQTDNRASGTVGVRSEVEVIINNAEKGTSIEIPIVKNLEPPDGKMHTYGFTLVRLESDGVTVASPLFEKKLGLDIKDASVTGSFEIDYPLREFETLPQTFVYRITEDASDELGTATDQAVYTVEVTVSETADGGISAAVTRITKDGEDISFDSTLSFTNRLSTYELPETGGSGTQMYTAGGLLLIATALLTYYKAKHRKEDTASE